MNSSSNWGVYSTQPSASGVKSYANASRSVGVALNSLSAATSSFNETVPSSGNWESAYDVGSVRLRDQRHAQRQKNFTINSYSASYS